MFRACSKEKDIVVDILSRSFVNNGSVNYVVGPGSDVMDRIRSLMSYSFRVSNLYGDVYLSGDTNACGLVVYPDLKKSTFSSLLWDVNLALGSIGIGRIGKVLKREKLIKSNHPQEPFTHLWYIGVLPGHQSNGLGSEVLDDIIHESWIRKRPVYLETSVERNIPWYKKHGFEVFQTIDMEYKLFMLRRTF